MIDSISIASAASYGSNPESLSDLSKFNYIFGANGSGKTTISRVIADEMVFPTCTVTWKGGTTLQPMVYNQDFVTTNFNQSAEFKGIFTLGEKNVDTLNKIAAAKIDVDALTKKVETLNQGLNGADGTGGKKGEMAVLETELKDRCWAQKQKHDEKLQGAFEGFRGADGRARGHHQFRQPGEMGKRRGNDSAQRGGHSADLARAANGRSDDRARA